MCQLIASPSRSGSVARKMSSAPLAARAMGFDVLFVLLDQVVTHRKAVVRIDCAFLGDQVAHVPIRGQDGEVLAEVFIDRLGLGGRFDDEQVLGHDGNFLGRSPGGG